MKAWDSLPKEAKLDVLSFLQEIPTACEGVNGDPKRIAACQEAARILVSTLVDRLKGQEMRGTKLESLESLVTNLTKSLVQPKTTPKQNKNE